MNFPYSRGREDAAVAQVGLSENAQEDDQPHRCRGVVRCARLEERTCDVYWLPCLNNQSSEPFFEENVSVYELTEHPDFDFLPGDTVLKLGGGTRWLGVVEDVLEDGTLRVDCWVERFDRRGIEPFEPFRSEFGQNSFKIQEFSLENSKIPEN